MVDEPFVSLYRRFRPGRFEELRGQPHVVLALRSAVRDDRVAHAYLFSGPRGTGKTSAARILAKALNCANPVDGEPCGVCSSCVEITRGTSLDVHELDAASNNGVDAMRDLIAHAALGTPGRSKVYIVDEVHMLSNAAANALLKTLEEPPGHVVFVLATTDPQKVPPTIRSRTQHFEFRLLGTDALASLVHDVNEAAGLALDDESLAVAVRRGRGSARDTLSALDQVAASGSADDARPELSEVVDALADEDAGRALVAVAALHEVGWGPQQLASELVDDLRQAFLVALAPELTATGEAETKRLSDQADRLGLPRLVRSMEVLGRAQVEMREAPDARVVLEVALVRLARPDLDDSTTALAERVSRLERGALAPRTPPAPAPPTPPAATGDPRTIPSIGALRRQREAAKPKAADGPPPDVDPAPAPPNPPAPAAAPTPPAPAAAPSPSPRALPDRDALVQAWGDHILRSLPARAKVLFAAGRFVGSDDGVAVFALPNAAHCDRCAEVLPVVEEALSSHFAVAVPVRLVVESDGASAKPAPPPGDLAEGDDFDPTAEGEAAPDAEARLLEAFPGAEEVLG
jgi:DNA polymerase-3 subunit gamma/tau